MSRLPRATRVGDGAKRGEAISQSARGSLRRLQRFAAYSGSQRPPFVIASEAKQSPSQEGDCFAAYSGSQ